MPYSRDDDTGRRQILVTGLKGADTALAAHDVESTPTAWAAVIEGMLKVRDPDLCEGVAFTAEAGTLRVSADTEKAIGFVQRNIDELERDRKLMVRCAEHAFPSGPLPVWHT